MIEIELCNNCHINPVGGVYQCPYSEDVFLKDNLCHCCVICRRECLDEM